MFRENMSQTFFMSILGIMALMGGSLMINIMFNLTRIAQRLNKDRIDETKNISKNLGLAFLLLFPLIFGLLYGGDYLTSKKKESMLIGSARSIIEKHPKMSDQFADYEFTKEWLDQTGENLKLIEASDRNFSNVTVIVKDKINDSDVFLGFRDYTSYADQENELQKNVFIFAADKPDRDYLQKYLTRD